MQGNENVPLVLSLINVHFLYYIKTSTSAFRALVKKTKNNKFAFNSTIF